MGKDGDQALSKLGWTGTRPRARTFPPRTRRSGAGPPSGRSSLLALTKGGALKKQG